MNRVQQQNKKEVTMIKIQFPIMEMDFKNGNDTKSDKKLDPIVCNADRKKDIKEEFPNNLVETPITICNIKSEEEIEHNGNLIEQQIETDPLNLDGNSVSKPDMSYAQLIAEALNNAPEQSLVLSDIYKAINAKYPYYKLETQGWQKCISSRLTLNKYFIKIKGKLVDKKWSYWKLSKDVPKSLLEKKIKPKNILSESINKEEIECNENIIDKQSATDPLNLDDNNIENSGSKPYMSYPQLIAEALNNAPEQTLILSDIYKAINAKYPYFKLETQGWQNSIKHYLIYKNKNKDFIKGKPFDEHSWYWNLSKDVPESLLAKRKSEKRRIKSEKRRILANKKIKKIKTDNHIEKSIPQNGVHPTACVLVHEGQKLKTFNCSQCNMKFVTTWKLRSHSLSVHKGTCTNPYKCSFCDSTFRLLSDLVKHITKNHEGKKSFRCSKCDSSFITKSHLATHVLKYHEGKKRYKCSFCDSEFRICSDLVQHITKNHEGKKSFKCSICDASFMVKEYMIVHEKNHEKKKPQCPICGIKRCNDKILKQHILSVHERDNPYKCHRCPSSFTEEQHLTRHNSQVHKENKIYKFSCSICDNERNFSSYKGLVYHYELVHEGRNPLKCDICEHTFYNFNSLKKHRHFSCSVCKNIYNRSGVVCHGEIAEDMNNRINLNAHIYRDKTLAVLTNNSFTTLENNQKTREISFPIKNEVKLEEEELKTSEVSKFTKSSQLQNLKGPKRFICSCCHVSFQDKHDLKTHNLSVHDGKKSI